LNPQFFVDTIINHKKCAGERLMAGFETLAVTLFVGWVLATSLFLRFG